MLTKLHRRSWTVFGLIVAMVVVLGPTALRAQNAKKEQSLKVALLPILDSLPYYVADASGFFADYGVNVKVIPVASGVERDQLMQAGAIDGMLNEMTSTATFNREKVQVKIISSARTAYPKYPLFRVLAAPRSGITRPAELSGVPIGISVNTIIEYVTDRLLTESGLDRAQIVKKSVPVIPERYQLLLQGQLRAATLPDPLAKSALEAGALLVVDDSTYPRYSVSVLSFSAKALNQKSEATRLFLLAWDRAAAKINANPDSYRAMLLKKIRLPKNVQEAYTIPPFPRGQVPDSGQWADVMNWMIEKGLLDSRLPYEDSITTDFLPTH